MSNETFPTITINSEEELFQVIKDIKEGFPFGEEAFLQHIAKQGAAVAYLGGPSREELMQAQALRDAENDPYGLAAYQCRQLEAQWMQILQNVTN